MLNLRKLIIDHFVEVLTVTYRRTYGDMEPAFGSVIAWSGRLALENIANSDALYHNVEHTILVTSVGQAILEGKHLCEGGVTPRDWMHVTIALLCHDIGYVRGVCRGDGDGVIATGIGDEILAVSNNGTDAALAPYHIDRSKLFVQERFGRGMLDGAQVDADLIASYIEMTRYPVPNDAKHQDVRGYAGLVRAADYIGQLGDPDYLRKGPALFYEFEEIGANKKYGYQQPGDVRAMFAGFYWGVVNPFIQDALRYLHQTQEGKEWIANVYALVFAAEHSIKR
jgi:hypothetical protein